MSQYPSFDRVAIFDMDILFISSLALAEDGTVSAVDPHSALQINMRNPFVFAGGSKKKFEEKTKSRHDRGSQARESKRGWWIWNPSKLN